MAPEDTRPASADERAEHARSRRVTNLIRVGSAGVLLLGVVSFVRDLDPLDLSLPLVSLSVPDGFEDRPTLPGLAGSLRGANVVLVTLDTTRPDRLGTYGNDAIETPALDRLAADGVLFSNALATGSTTLPTHASILTGRYPHHHGARANLLYSLDRREQTLAEILAASNYDTAAFVSTMVLDSRFGLDQGFALYDDDFQSETEATTGERRGDLTTDRAIRWLKRSHERPFFLWVHYFDPHADYAPPEEFDRFENHYDGELAFVDAQLGRLLDASERANGRETLIVVTADHAESFGVQNEWTHGYLVHEAVLRIPLIMHSPKALGRGTHVPTRTSQVDLAPTILSLLGIDASVRFDGIDLTAPVPTDRSVLAESAYGRANYGWASLSALYEDSWKVVDGPSPELYDFASDPLEEHNLAGELSSKTERMRGRLRSLRGPDGGRFESAVASLAAEDFDLLSAIGYVVGGVPSEGLAHEGIDPREMLPILNRLYRLQARYKEGGAPFLHHLTALLTGQTWMTTRAEFIDELEALATDHPDFAPVYALLAAQYRLEGSNDESSRAARRFAEAVSGRAPPP